jgi:hypothetical protein
MLLSQRVISECNLQHKILGLVNGNTLRQLIALLQQFGICGHQDAPAEDQKDEKSLGAKTPYSPTDGSLFAAICMGMSCSSPVQP